MATLWDGQNGMRIHLKFQITNHDLHKRITVYRSEDDRWYVICVDLRDLHATSSEFVETLDEALEFIDIKELRSCLEDQGDKTRVPIETVVLPSGVLPSERI